MTMPAWMIPVWWSGISSKTWTNISIVSKLKMSSSFLALLHIINTVHEVMSTCKLTLWPWAKSRQLKAPRLLPIATKPSKILLMISIRLHGSRRVSLNWFMPLRTKFSFVIHVKVSTRRLLSPWKIRANKFIISSLILSIGVDLQPWPKTRFRSLIFEQVTKFCLASRARRNNFKHKDKEEIWIHMGKLSQASIGASTVRTWSSHIQNEATMQGSGIW